MSLKFSLSAVKTVNINMTFDILNKNSFMSHLTSLSFYFLFEISIHKNVLTFSIKTFSATDLLMRISIYKKTLNLFLFLLTAVIFNKISALSSVCDLFELITVNLFIISMFKTLKTVYETINVEKSFESLITDVFTMNFTAITFFYDCLTDFCFSRMLNVCFCRLSLTLSLFSFSVNLTAWLLMIYLRFEIQSRYCFVIFLIYFMKTFTYSQFMNLFCLFFSSDLRLIWK